jgi:hypothetical protein
MAGVECARVSSTQAPAGRDRGGLPAIPFERAPAARESRPLPVAATIAWLVTAGVMLLYITRGGGSFDVVPRQEVSIGLWWILAIGFAAGVLPRARPELALVPIAALLMLASWTALSLIWTQSDERTLTEVTRVLGFAGLMLVAVCTLDRGTWRGAANALVMVALGLCVVAVISRLRPDAFPKDLVRESFGGTRLNYPFNYWNAVGAWASLSIALGLAWSAHAKQAIVRVVCLAALPAAALCAYLTYSRAAVGGIAVAVVCVWAFARARTLVAVHALTAAAGAAIVILAARHEPAIARGTGGAGAGAVTSALLVAAALCAVVAAITYLIRADAWRLPPRASRALAIAGGVACIVVLPPAAIVGLPEAWDSFKGPPPTATTTDPAQRLTNFNSNRYYVFSSELDEFGREPLLGTGAGTFEFTWNRDAKIGEFVRDGHSIFLEPMAELGIVGLLLVLSFLGGAFALMIVAWTRARRAESAGAIAGAIAAFAAFVVHASVDWMWESTAVAALALLGVAVAGASLGGRPQRRAALGLPLRAAAAIGSLAVILLMLPGLASTQLRRDSEARARAGDLGGALTRADQAVDAQPWSAPAYAQRGLVEEARGRLEAARADLAEAAAREPENWRYPLLLARIDAERGDAAAAVANYRRARTLRPRAVVFAVPPPPP